MAQKISDINWEWVTSHLGDDPIKLRLKKDVAEHMLDIVQIECRRKAGKKLSSTLEQNPKFIFGNTLASEQSTSDMLAQYHASLIPEGSKVCDLTSGLGIDVLHVAQRASSVTAIELQSDLCEALEINAQADRLASDKVRVINGDCREVLRDLCGVCNKDKKSFDVIFIDPARRSSTGRRLFSLHDCQPDVVEMITLIRQACNTLIIKMSPMLDITQVCRELPCVSQIIVLGTNRECKELIAVCKWDKPGDEEPEISVVTLSSERIENIPKSETHLDVNLHSEQSICETAVNEQNPAQEVKLVQSESGIKGVSTEYLCTGSSVIKVEKFCFHSSEESSVSGVKYMNAQSIERLMRELDNNFIGSRSCDSYKGSMEAKKTKKGMSEAHSLDSCNPVCKLKEDILVNEKSLESDLKGENLTESRETLFLYEPSPSMMKASAYQLLAERFSLRKMAPNSHLYLSNTLREDFPGTVWRVRRIYPLNSSTIKALSKQNLKGEVAVRNYPMAAEPLRKKLKIGDGVGYRYMATTLGDGLAYLYELT